MIDYYNNESRLTEILRAVVDSSTIDLGPARTREEIFVSRAFGLTMWPAIPPRTTLEMWLAFIAGDAAEPAAGTYTVRTCAESCIITYARRVRGASAVVPIFVPHTHYERALAKLAGIVPLNWGVLGREWEHLLQILTSSTMPRSAVAVIGGERVGIGPGGEITPFQDLHGYSSPWPAGGGKNKAHDVVYANQASRYDPAITASYNLEAGARYIFSFMTENTGEQVYRQTPPILGLTSVSNYDFTCDGTRKRFYGAAAPNATITNKDIICKLENDGIPVGLCSQFMVEKVEDTVTTPSAYEPYSNLCPITPGLTLVRDDESTLVIYGGTLDVATDKLTVTDAEIASYAGESIPGEWISDRDAYAAGAVPTTGAQVVYKLAEPLTYQLTRAEVQRALNCAEYLGVGTWRLSGGVTIIRSQIRTEAETNHYDLAASSEDWSFTITVDDTTAAGGSGIISVAAGDHDVVIVATPGDGAGVCIIHPTLYYTAVAGLLGSRQDMEEAVEPEEPEEPAEPEPVEPEPEEPEPVEPEPEPVEPEPEEPEPVEPEPEEPEPEEPAEPEEPQEPKEPKEPVEPEEPQTTKRRRTK